ncbi:MAG: hypothetical protein P8P36_05850, partial [Akkermansiaceae bacterium]|nr:hypothetical protein [Akkermansiaceae bacterium]
MKYPSHLLALISLSLVTSSCCSVRPSCGGPSSVSRDVSIPGKAKAKTRVRRAIDSGTVTPEVLAVVSAQANGEPHIGLIPTMKELAASD